MISYCYCPVYYCMLRDRPSLANIVLCTVLKHQQRKPPSCICPLVLLSSHIHSLHYRYQMSLWLSEARPTAGHHRCLVASEWSVNRDTY